MSYKITVRLYQFNQNAFFRVAETTVWNYANGGVWDIIRGAHCLTIGDNGTSGSMRFMNQDYSEGFTVTAGVHNYKRWCDIVTNLKLDETACIIQPQYYGGSRRDREAVRESQNTQHSATNSKGRKIEVRYTQGEGNEMLCNVIIN